MSQERLLTAAELAVRLSVGKSTVYRMYAKGYLRAKPVGANLGGLRFDEAEVREALDKLSKTRRAYHPAGEECSGSTVNT